MRLLDLALAAKDVITGPGKWARHNRDDGKGGHCAMGAIEEALGVRHIGRGAENNPLAKQLVVRLGRLINPKIRHDDESKLVEVCAGRVMRFNDQGSQRKVLNLFQRAADQLKQEYDSRRYKRQVNAMLREAAKTPALAKVELHEKLRA